MVKDWIIAREAYPGFIICPRNSRNRIWQLTDGWVCRLVRSQLLQNSQQSDPIYCLSLLYEINWRLEKCLTPLYSEILDSIESVLSKINPFPNTIALPPSNSAITPQNTTIEKDGKTPLDWSKVRNQWMNLAFVLIKEARRDRDKEKFYFWIARIEKIVILELDLHSKWFYEQCLFESISLDKGKLNSLLKDWQHLNLSSMWQVKLSGILFEIGDCIKAEEIARQALADIRSRLRSYVVNYSLLSQEGVAMIML